MRADLEEKISELKELFLQREGIEERIAALLSGSGAPRGRPPAKKEGGMAGRTCGSCGKKGHRRDHCGEIKHPDRTENSRPLTEHEWEDVQVSREHGMKSKEIADNMGVALVEVNQAFGSPDYDYYLSHR